MTAALGFFHRNFSQARGLLDVAKAIGRMVTPALDVSDVIRASLVAGVSAQDAYFHLVVRELMIEISDGRRPTTPAFGRFLVPMSSVQVASSLPSQLWLDRVVAEATGHLAFQQPDKIADALRWVSSLELWNSLAVSLGTTAKALKTRQKLIVDRRNQIVHEADCELVPPYQRRPITEGEVSDALDFLESIAVNVDGLL